MLVGEDGEQNIVYVVQPGDTLSDIAQNFGTTISAISQANKLGSQQVIRPGQRLTIAYNEGIIYDLTQSTTLAEFANKYDLNTQDLMTLNYIQDEDQLLEPGQQLFLDLNKIEAESRGLIQKKKHEMLEFDSELKQQISDNQA
jgi:spore germination protein YaaH